MFLLRLEPRDSIGSPPQVRIFLDWIDYIHTLRKHGDAVAELSDQLEQVQKIKVKIEKDKQQMQRELEDATQAADSESRGRSEAEKVIKNLELQARRIGAEMLKSIPLVERIAIEGRWAEPLVERFQFLEISPPTWERRFGRRQQSPID